MFNRLYSISGFLISFVVGALRHDDLLYQLSYKPIGNQINTFMKIRFGVLFMFIYFITALAMISTVQLLKISLKRARPEPSPNAIRIGSLRNAELGTYSMPSGDAAAAALFCYLYYSMLKLPAVYLILPLVMLGRVYYHCHWFGDTIVGVLIGTFWGIIAYAKFALLFLPLAKAITGPTFFVPL